MTLDTWQVIKIQSLQDMDHTEGLYLSAPTSEHNSCRRWTVFEINFPMIYLKEVVQDKTGDSWEDFTAN